ncbi:SMC-Scp complex subunit ScpB [Nisaea acidiphila]|uniref:SMC-Scp complex subunit ScpB n=1 Tax=Nisaea acidiphila TaxID=1862145 RepID=A0A9J7ASA0_9PROT|nr:SMC-Scp complex subunit ScpB [Nisaea acidiphila]UUX50094.1 SMC-Scp complex subunit ScpB [Nisaea acidiphila]
MSSDQTETNGPSRAERIVEALLFASKDPLSPAEIDERLPDGVSADAILETLQKRYADRGIHLVKIKDCWAFRTAPDIGEALRIEVAVRRKLSRAALETLSIIAYHEPVTRADIEEIRGVAVSKGTLDALLEAGWIQPRGRRQVPGRPLTWGTTEAFLDHFGLSSLGDLPGLEELKATGMLDKRPGLTSIAMGDKDDLDDDEEEDDGQFELLEAEDGS